MKKTWLCLFLAVVAAGCEDDEKGDPAEECTGECLIDLAISDCHALMGGFCSYFYRCYSGDTLAALEAAGGFSDEVTCVEATSAEACDAGSLDEALTEGRQKVDGEAVSDCINAFEGLDCVPLDDLFVHPGIAEVCEDVPAGQVAQGDACVESDDCAGLDGFCNADSECESREPADYQIECDLPLAAGDCPGNVCVTFVANQQGLSGTCTRLCEENEDCGYASVCVPVGEDAACFAACLDNTDCTGGLVCRIQPSHTVGICSVTPL